MPNDRVDSLKQILGCEAWRRRHMGVCLMRRLYRKPTAISLSIHDKDGELEKDFIWIYSPRGRSSTNRNGWVPERLACLDG